MNIHRWFSLLSTKQRFWLSGTAALMLIIIGFGILMNPDAEPKDLADYSIAMSIGDIAPKLKVTG